MNNYVPNFEDRYYEVHPRNLGWAMHDLSQKPGYNVQGYAPGEGGMYIIVVQVPVGTPQADWRTPQARRRTTFDISPRVVGVLVAIALLCAVVGYAAYSGVTVPTWDEVAQNIHMPEPIAQMFEPQPPRGEPVVEKTGFRWPWESSVVSQPQAKQEGFRWPWQDAQDAAGEMMESAKMAGLMIVGLFLVLGALWIVGIVRGALGK